jgi:hypothetical protein
MKTRVFQAILLLFIFVHVQAQENPFKLGKLEASAFSSNICPIDSAADAYILGDYGKTSYDYNDTKGFQTIFEKHIRIKICKKSAFDWANFGVSSYFASGSEEKVTDIKGFTFNMENDKVVVSKMEKSAIFKEEVNEHNRNIKFTLPNVKEGSVIEVYYRVISDFFSIRDWDFQHSIPVLSSRYQLEIPEYFNYKIFQNGYEAIMVNKTSRQTSLTINSKEVINNRMTYNTQFSQDKIDYQLNSSTYSAVNVKAFHDEPFMKSRKNYMSSLEVELQSIQFPNSMVKDYTSNWKQIISKLLDHENFGDLILRQGGSGNVVDQIADKVKDPLQKATLLYEYVRDNIKWDGTNRLYASKSIRKILDEKSGNSADMNLLLIRLFKKSGLSAEPVVLSTRDNGIIVMGYPVLQKLNYVVAKLDINGKRYLLDATDKHCPFGLLPEKCLNGQGKTISELNQEEVDLTSAMKYSENILANLKLTENGELNGTWQESRRAYAANYYRKKIENAKGPEGFVKELQKNNNGLSITNAKIENYDSVQNDLKTTYDVSINSQVEATGNLFMIHPLLYEQMQQNPFKSEDRKFPVDFSYGFNKLIVISYQIPNGYQIETLPKPLTLSMPDNKASFIYRIDIKDNTIQLMRKFVINTTTFLPEEYKQLKEFYNQVVNKEAEIIVMKKSI